MGYTDEIITNFYLSIGMDNLNCFTMEYISKSLNFTLYLDTQQSKIYMDETIQLLIIDARLNEQQQLEDFFHLIATFIIYPIRLHGYDSFTPYDEKQVTHLALHLAMPQHLLDILGCTSDSLEHKLAETFKVSEKNARQRAKQLLSLA